MSSSDQLYLAPAQMESAAAQLINDSVEATAVSTLMSEIGTGFGTPETGLSVAAALTSMGDAFAGGFVIVATELTDLSVQVDAAAQLSVLVDDDAAGYFTASDAI